MSLSRTENIRRLRIHPTPVRRRPRRVLRMVQSEPGSRRPPGAASICSRPTARSRLPASCEASISPTTLPGRRSTSPASKARSSTSSSTCAWDRRRSGSGIGAHRRRRPPSGLSLRRARARHLVPRGQLDRDVPVLDGIHPRTEHEVHPLDPDLAIDWPTVGRSGEPLNITLSAKDTAAPSLQDAVSAGLLPTFGEG